MNRSKPNKELRNYFILLFIFAGFVTGVFYFGKWVVNKISSVPWSDLVEASTVKNILLVAAVIAGIILLFRLLKNKKMKFDKWRLFLILVTLGTLVLLNWKYHWYDRLSVHFGDTAAPSSSTSRAPAKVVYQKLRINDGRNELKRGEFQLFKINWDEPAINFIPDKQHAKDTLVLRFEKLEDRSRWWEVEVRLDKKGKPVYRHITPDEPYPEAQVGDVLVCVKNQDATVTVQQ